MRVGIGYDAHRFEDKRPLIIGGVKIDYFQGLQGHSDADVLIHAVIDALLGAVGAGDIGYYFPQDDPNWEGISSLILLEEINKKITFAGFKVEQIDSIIIAEQPKLTPYLGEMRSKLAERLGIQHTLVNVKATTTEGMGFTGRGEGIAAQAVAVLGRN